MRKRARSRSNRGSPWTVRARSFASRLRAPRRSGQLAPETVLIGFLAPLSDDEGIERLRTRGVIGFAMESIPRITRAQSMDALSSQATVAGYKAVVLAADRRRRCSRC